LISDAQRPPIKFIIRREKSIKSLFAELETSFLENEEQNEISRQLNNIGLKIAKKLNKTLHKLFDSFASLSNE
jgi:uncharacterized protein (DUF302 family)